MKINAFFNKITVAATAVCVFAAPLIACGNNYDDGGEEPKGVRVTEQEYSERIDALRNCENYTCSLNFTYNDDYEARYLYKYDLRNGVSYGLAEEVGRNYIELAYYILCDDVWYMAISKGGREGHGITDEWSCRVVESVSVSFFNGVFNGIFKIFFGESYSDVEFSEDDGAYIAELIGGNYTIAGNNTKHTFKLYFNDMYLFAVRDSYVGYDDNGNERGSGNFEIYFSDFGATSVNVPNEVMNVVTEYIAEQSTVAD